MLKRSWGSTTDLIGLLSPGQYAGCAERAVAGLQKHFSSWAEAAASYWWGRAIWAAATIRDDGRAIQEELQHFNYVFTEALTDPHSPWRCFPGTVKRFQAGPGGCD